MDIKRMVRLKYPIKSILIHECQHESTQISTSPTRVNANQHESNTSQNESTRVRHESTGINQKQDKRDTSQHESTRINTSPTRFN